MATSYHHHSNNNKTQTPRGQTDQTPSHEQRIPCRSPLLLFETFWNKSGKCLMSASWKANALFTLYLWWRLGRIAHTNCPFQPLFRGWKTEISVSKRQGSTSSRDTCAKIFSHWVTLLIQDSWLLTVNHHTNTFALISQNQSHGNRNWSWSEI